MRTEGIEVSEHGPRRASRDSNIVAVGLNHLTAPIEIRETLVVRSVDVGSAARGLMGPGALDECVILSTCNRTEVYGVGRAPRPEQLLCALAHQHGIKASSLDGHLYHHQGADAVVHLSRVASGLDSMVMGEGQVLGQVKAAIEDASAAHTAGPILNALFRQAVTAGKRARTETEIMRGAVSVSHAAVELAQQIFGHLSGCRALVLGAGEMSEITLKLLRNAGMRTSIMISSRTPERARALAERCQGIGVEWCDFPRALEDADIVIVSTSAPRIIVKLETIRNAMKARRGRHMFLIDISVPRNVDPEAGDLPDVFLYNIDDLQNVVERNLGDRTREVEKVETIIAEEVERFQQWLRGLDVVPAIVGLRSHAESVRQQEWERFADRMSHLSERDLQSVEAMTRQLVNKLLHQPVVQLKELGVNGKGYDRVEVVRELFGLAAPALSDPELAEIQLESGDTGEAVAGEAVAGEAVAGEAVAGEARGGDHVS